MPMNMHGNAIIGLLIFLWSPFSFARGHSLQRIHFDEINSTQSYAKNHIQEFLKAPDEWVVITASRQTQGVGHCGRVWVSSCDGNIYATFALVFPYLYEALLFNSIQVTALAVSEVLLGFSVQPEIKWINDVYVSGKKIAGCLCEAIPSPFPDLCYLLIGIGINVNMTPDELSLLRNPATSLLAETSRWTDKEEILNRLCQQLLLNVGRLVEEGFSPFYKRLDQVLMSKDRLVDLQLEPELVIRGRVVGIDPAGALLLAKSGGSLEPFFTGTILEVVDESDAD